MKRLAILFLATFAHAALSDDGVDITDPNEVAALTGLQKTLDTVSTAVTNCVGSGKSHGDCLCESEALILEFNETVEQLFSNYPMLKTLDLVRFRTATGEMINQSLVGIGKQAEMGPPCS